MSELYLTANGKRGNCRFRFEADGMPLVDLIANLTYLRVMKVPGGPANDPIAVSGIRKDDALLTVMVGREPTPALSDRIAFLTRYTTISNSNQITISVDTTGMELLVVFFSDLV